MAIDGSNLANSLFLAAANATQIAPPSQDVSVGDGYSVQERAFLLRQVPVAGWKLALTSEAAQRAAGVGHPVAGRLATTAIRIAPHEIEMTAGPLYAEAELAVTIARDLPARAEPYNVHEVAAAIGDIHASIELCTSRYENDDVGPGLLVADNAFAHMLVLGDRLGRGWHTRFEALPVILSRSDARPVQGSTSAVMGNPLHALVWLANWPSARGHGLQAGQIVATGSCTGVVEVRAGEHLRTTFENMAEAVVTIAPGNVVRRFG